MRYELYYWPGIQGRGEFIRLALEAAGADYSDIGNATQGALHGVPGLMRYLEDPAIERAPFAPPYLRAGRLLISQTSNILLYLGPKLGLLPKDPVSRLWANQLQLVIADMVLEAHDTHHPISSMEYYEDQKPEAHRRAQVFIQTRIPKFMAYFEQVLVRNAKGPAHLVEGTLSYADLSLFQLVSGLRYAFPKTMKKGQAQWPHVTALVDLVAAQPRIAAYLRSQRRMSFNESGIFRRYPALERPSPSIKL